MTQESGKRRLNLAPTAAAMTLLAVVLTAALFFVMPMLGKSGSVEESAPAAAVSAGRTVLITSAITWACAMLGLLVTYAVRNAEPIIVLKAHMLGHTLRLFMTLGLGVALVKVSGMEVFGVVITMSALYLPLMAVEAAMTAAEFRRCFSTAGQPPAASEALS